MAKKSATIPEISNFS